MAAAAKNEQKKKAESFEDLYKKLQSITESTQESIQQELLTSFAKSCGNIFDFKQYDKIVTKDSNEKLFQQLSQSLIQYKENYDLQIAIFQTIRVLSRSRMGINHLMAEKVIYILSLHIVIIIIISN